MCGHCFTVCYVCFDVCCNPAFLAAKSNKAYYIITYTPALHVWLHCFPRTMKTRGIILFLSITILGTNRFQQANFEKIVMPPTCLWFCYYLFNEIRFHFHLCVTGIPANLKQLMPLQRGCSFRLTPYTARSGSYAFTLCDPVTFTFDRVIGFHRANFGLPRSFHSRVTELGRVEVHYRQRLIVRTSPLRRSGVDHTVLLANTPHLPLPRSSPEGATTE